MKINANNNKCKWRKERRDGKKRKKGELETSSE